MKKQFLLILFAIFSCNLFAQSNSIGVFGGVNVIDIVNFDNYKLDKSDKNSMIGFVGGVKYQRVFNIPIVVDVSMLYNQCRDYINYQKTTTEHPDGGIGYYQFCFHYDYLSYPVLFGYKFGNTFFVIPKAGIQPSFLINRDKVFESNKDFLGFMYDTFNERYREKYNSFDLALVLDVELGYQLSKCLGVFLSVSGKYSVTKCRDVDEYDKNYCNHHVVSTVCGVKYSF